MLCKNGTIEKSYPISLGRSGAGKKRQGDHKTPLGKYLLGQGRPSNEFHIFIPVAYPTPEQKKMGFTGADIGIHGPPRWISWVGILTRWFDWTNGCVAVGTDAEIEAISNWQKESGCHGILIQ